jgi:hypothetical protein
LYQEKKATNSVKPTKERTVSMRNKKARLGM